MRFKSEMASRYQYPDSQQPDTQPVTQQIEESLACSEEDDVLPPPQYWGRLYPASRGVLMQDLTNITTVVGKTSSCDITITQDTVSQSMLGCMSKKHFVITRTVSSNGVSPDIVIELTDSSLNGTFVNGTKVSKGKTVQLHNDAVIAVAKPEYKLFVFIESKSQSDEHAIIHKKFAVSKKLGSGSYGEVKLVFNKETGMGYAMKVMKKSRFVNADQKMEIEIKILRNISHPNVMRLVEEYDSPTHKYLVLHYMEGGDLCERINKQEFLSEPQTKLYFKQLVSGMIYLHDRGIIHRDMKPENVLLATNEVDTIVKITDFGLSKILDSGCIMQTICGTKLYVAPEILFTANSAPSSRSSTMEERRVSSHRSSTHMTSYTEKVDVWSLGVMLYVCLCGRTPFTPPTDPERGPRLEDQIKEGKFGFRDKRWKCVSTKAKLLIKKMMTRDPAKRISLSEIKTSQWLTDSGVDEKVEQLVKAFESFGSFEQESGVNKENKRHLNGSFEETARKPAKRPKVEVMDCS